MATNGFKSKGDRFLFDVTNESASRGLRLHDHWDIDHICYRVSELALYHEMKMFLAPLGDLLFEGEVNGRPIATYRMHEPFFANGRRVDLLELPAPKPGDQTPEGFEHIEVVCDVTFDDLRAISKNVRAEINEGGLRKPFNQEFKFGFGSMAVKFHQLSLHSVVRLEANATVFAALRDSHVLEVLRAYSPLVAGTFPLGISVDNSDIDVILQARDLQALGNELREAFQNHADFSIRNTEKSGKATLICNFTFNGVPFELFAQDEPSVLQAAYRHFLAEERALKFGGDHLRGRVLALRAQGLKTEPAFAKALGLPGEPYEAVFKLATMPEAELSKLVLFA